MRILSFDCGIKTLAVSHVNFLNINKILKECVLILKDENINSLEKLKLVYNKLNFMEFIECSVHDILNGKKEKSIKELEKIHMVSNFIDKNYMNKDSDLILIEHQPKLLNTKSTMIEYILIVKFIYKNVDTIKPILKNKFNLIGTLNDFKIKYPKKNAYALRKSHSKETFLYLLKVFNCEYIIKDIKKCFYDDIADAFLQSLYYFINKYC